VLDDPGVEAGLVALAPPMRRRYSSVSIANHIFKTAVRDGFRFFGNIKVGHAPTTPTTSSTSPASARS
jgi:hypothetical protein